jgi:hypothetical protein
VRHKERETRRETVRHKERERKRERQRKIERERQRKRERVCVCVCEYVIRRSFVLTHLDIFKIEETRKASYYGTTTLSITTLARTTPSISAFDIVKKCDTQHNSIMIPNAKCSNAEGRSVGCRSDKCHGINTITLFFPLFRLASNQESFGGKQRC